MNTSLTYDRTTDNNTTSFAQSLAHLFGLDSSPFLELLVRGVRTSAPRMTYLHSYFLHFCFCLGCGLTINRSASV